MKKTTMIAASVLLLLVISTGVYFLSQQSSNEAMMQKKDSIKEAGSQNSMEQSDAIEEDVMVKTDQISGSIDSMKKDESIMESDGGMEKSSMNDASMMTSVYVEYAPEVLTKTAGTKRVLFFYASWCPTCIPADVEFKKSQDKIPSGVTVIRVNYNDPQTDEEEKALAQKYGVTYQHTYVQIDANGKQVTKWNGGQLNELLSNIK